jgi:FG-GAP repeat
MATNARTQGANARQINWEEADRKSSQRTGSWMPLDALDDDDPIYSGTPQLHSMPAPSRQIAVPQAPRRQEVAPTRPQPTRAAQPDARPNPLEKVVPTKAVAMAGAIIIAALATYVLLSAAIEWAQVRMDDVQYGRPRTVQLDAYVGQNETDGVPSHFIAMNLNRRVTIVEMQGGDPTKVNTIVGPYLFGEGEDLTPVQLSATDLNGDSKADLVVSVKNEQLLYLNDGTSFKLATPEERASIEKTLSTAKPTGGSATTVGVSK